MIKLAVPGTDRKGGWIVKNLSDQKNNKKSQFGIRATDRKINEEVQCIFSWLLEVQYILWTNIYVDL